MKDMSIEFFKPDDFQYESEGRLRSIMAADIANAKLEKEGCLIYCDKEGGRANWSLNKTGAKYKALIINIEPIEKCDHPKDKINVLVNLQKRDINASFFSNPYSEISLSCQCGANLDFPSNLQEIK